MVENSLETFQYETKSRDNNQFDTIEPNGRIVLRRRRSRSGLIYFNYLSTVPSRRGPKRSCHVYSSISSSGSTERDGCTFWTNKIVRFTCFIEGKYGKKCRRRDDEKTRPSSP